MRYYVTLVVLMLRIIPTISGAKAPDLEIRRQTSSSAVPRCYQWCRGACTASKENSWTISHNGCEARINQLSTGEKLEHVFFPAGLHLSVVKFKPFRVGGVGEGDWLEHLEDD